MKYTKVGIRYLEYSLSRTNFLVPWRFEISRVYCFWVSHSTYYFDYFVLNLKSFYLLKPIVLRIVLITITISQQWFRQSGPISISRIPLIRVCLQNICKNNYFSVPKNIGHSIRNNLESTPPPPFPHTHIIWKGLWKHMGRSLSSINLFFLISLVYRLKSFNISLLCGYIFTFFSIVFLILPGRSRPQSFYKLTWEVCMPFLLINHKLFILHIIF